MKEKIAPLAIALAAAILGTFVMLKTPIADATHYWSGYKTQSDTVNWCPAYNMPTIWKDSYAFAAARWNSSPSDWTLVNSSCTFFAGQMSFSGQGLPPNLGITTIFVNGSGLIVSAVTALNTDYSWDFYQSEGENMCDPNCDVTTVILHEMDHWVSLVDPNPCTHSVMCRDLKVRRFITDQDSGDLILIYGV